MAKVSKYGQWKYPGEDTIVPTPDGRITMKDVPYPVLGIDNKGNRQMMMPGMDYQFSGKSVYEIPMVKSGGTRKVKIKKLPKAQIIGGIEYLGDVTQDEDNYWEQSYNKWIGKKLSPEEAYNAATADVNARRGPSHPYYVYNANSGLPNENSGVVVPAQKPNPYKHLQDWPDFNESGSAQDFYGNTDDAVKWEKQWYSRRANLPQFKDIAEKRLSLADSIEMQPWSADNWQNSLSPYATGYYSWDDATVNIPQSYFSRPSLYTHERSHWYDYNAPQDNMVTSYYKGKPIPLYNEYDPILNNIIPDEYMTPGGEGATNDVYSKEGIYSPFTNDDPNYDVNYYYNPTEVRARLNEWRRRLNIDPTKNYSNDEIQQIIDKDINSGDRGSFDLYKVLRGRGDLLKQINDSYVSTGDKENSDELPKAQRGLRKAQTVGQFSNPNFKSSYDWRKSPAENAELNRRAEAAGHNSVGEYEASGWAWQPEKTHFTKGQGTGIGIIKAQPQQQTWDQQVMQGIPGVPAAPPKAAPSIEDQVYSDRYRIPENENDIDYSTVIKSKIPGLSKSTHPDVQMLQQKEAADVAEWVDTKYKEESPEEKEQRNRESFIKYNTTPGKEDLEKVNPETGYAKAAYTGRPGAGPKLGGMSLWNPEDVANSGITDTDVNEYLEALYNNQQQADRVAQITLDLGFSKDEKEKERLSAELKDKKYILAQSDKVLNNTAFTKKLWDYQTGRQEAANKANMIGTATSTMGPLDAAVGLAAGLPALSATMAAPILGTSLTLGSAVNPFFYAAGINGFLNPNSDFSQAAEAWSKGKGSGTDVLLEAGLNTLNFLGYKSVPTDIGNFGKAYKEIATGESIIPYAWKSPAVGLSQEASADMFNSLLNSGKMTPVERNIVLEYQNNPSAFTGRFGSVDPVKRSALNDIIGKYELQFPQNSNAIATRRFNFNRGNLGANIENGRINFGDRPTSFSAGLGIEGYNGAPDRLVIPSRYLPKMKNNFITQEYSAIPKENLELIGQPSMTSREKLIDFGSGIGTTNEAINAERELLGTGLDFKQIGKVKNDIGGFDYVVKPRNIKPKIDTSTTLKVLPGSPNSAQYQIRGLTGTSTKTGLTEENVAAAIEREKQWIQSDEYIRRRAANTGETVEQIKADVAKILSTAEDARFNLNANITAQGQMTPKSLFNRVPGVEVAKHAYNPINTLEHETGHLYSPSIHGQTDAALHKGMLEADVASLPASERGVYANYPTLGKGFDKTSDAIKLGAEENYLNLGYEQQVRHLNARADILKANNLPLEAHLTEAEVKPFVDTWAEKMSKLVKDPKNPDLLKGEMDYDELWLQEALKIREGLLKEYGVAADSELTAAQRLVYKQRTREELTKVITDVLNKAWIAVPAIGVGAGMQQKKRGGAVNAISKYKNKFASKVNNDLPIAQSGAEVDYYMSSKKLNDEKNRIAQMRNNVIPISLSHSASSDNKPFNVKLPEGQHYCTTRACEIEREAGFPINQVASGYKLMNETTPENGWYPTAYNDLLPGDIAQIIRTVGGGHTMVSAGDAGNVPLQFRGEADPNQKAFYADSGEGNNFNFLSPKSENTLARWMDNVKKINYYTYKGNLPQYQKEFQQAAHNYLHDTSEGDYGPMAPIDAIPHKKQGGMQKAKTRKDKGFQILTDANGKYVFVKT
jgi:hypothetical protein